MYAVAHLVCGQGALVEGVFTRITDDELKASVERMTKIALEVAIAA